MAKTKELFKDVRDNIVDIQVHLNKLECREKVDLAMIQKMNIDTLHKEGKSQKVITERCGCLQSAVSKHIKCKVDWKEEFG